MLLETLASLMGVAVWTGFLVVVLLIRQDPLILRRYFRVILIAWTLLIGYETLGVFIDRDRGSLADGLPFLLHRLPGFFDSYPHTSRMWEMTLTTLVFRLIIVVATWRLIRDLVKPIAVSTVPIPEAQIEIDAHGIITAWNHAATVLFGWTPEEIMGQELAAYLIPPESREQHRAGLARYRDTSVSSRKDTSYAQVALTKSGQRMAVMIRFTERLDSRGTHFVGQLTRIGAV